MVIIPREQVYQFEDLDELYKIAKEDVPTVSRQDVHAHHPEEDEWQQVPWRDSLWTDDGRLAGEVSASDDFYNVIQYGDVLEATGQAIEQRPEDIEPEGQVVISPSGHKMSAQVGLDQTVEPTPGDEIQLDNRIRTGHSGYHGLKFDIGATRMICSNGMMAFDADKTYEQTHSDPFNPALAQHAVDAAVEGVDRIEERLEQAQERELMNRDEAMLVLYDTGIDQYLENPTSDLALALNEEVEDPENPNLYEVHNAATYALTHLTGDSIPQYQLDDGYEAAAGLLEYGDGLPSPQILGENAVRHRANDLIEDPDSEEYWEGETESVRELMEAHEVQA